MIVKISVYIGLITMLFIQCNINPAARPRILGNNKGDLPLEKIQLPKGFSIDIYAQKVINARGMSLGPDGVLYVGSRDEGKIYAIVDKNQDFFADTVFVIDEGLSMPAGVAYFKGDLYVSAVNRIVKYTDISNTFQSNPEPVVVYDAFPSENHHGWKYIAFGPDEKLYVPVGAPCNICESEDPVFASMTRMNPDGSEFEIVQHGIRNSVGFDWHPETGELYFTDNGRDMLGNDKPTCELNRATKDQMHFGYPYCHQGDILDPKLGEGKDCADYTAPFQNLGPHVAPLGMEFYQGKMFPNSFDKRIIIAEHGSWNRQEPIGYRLSYVDIEEDGSSGGYKMFAEGWLEDGKAWGRPVDMEVMPDGSMLVSDDFADVIYRITYTD